MIPCTVSRSACFLTEFLGVDLAGKTGMVDDQARNHSVRTPVSVNLRKRAKRPNSGHP